MPQIQVIDTTPRKPEPTGVEKFFSKLGKDYRDEKDRAEIGKILDEYKKNREDANAWEDLQLNLEKSDISPTRRLQTQHSLNEMRKNIVAKDKALNGSLKPNEFQKVRQKKGAEELGKLEAEIPKIQDNIKNLNTIEKTFEKNLQGATGYVKAWTNSQSAKEVENLSASSLDSIIKIFNPAGALPTAKLNWIRDTFGIKASDRVDTMRGKVNAQRILANQALQRSQQKAKLLKQYDGLIPDEIESYFDAETLQANDALADKMSFDLKIADLGEDDLVKGLYNKNGKRMDPMPKKDAITLFNHGLITNEPQ